VNGSSKRPVRLNGGCVDVSRARHEDPRQERRASENDNANTLDLHTNEEERASGGRHPAENDYMPLQSPYAPHNGPAQPTVEQNFAPREDATHRTSEADGDYIDRCAANVTPDGTADQRELERLADGVRLVQREEATARLPKTAQLASVPGLAPVGDGIWPPSLEPDYLAHRDALRGPRTMMKMTFLIVGILSVPMAYYFWMGGWDTIPGTSLPELARFNSKVIIPPPKPSGEEETITARGGNPGTPGKVEPRTAESSAGETATMLQPDTPGAHDPKSSTAAYALDLPRPQSQRETAIARDDDPRSPAKAEPRTGKSSSGDGTPHSSTVARVPNPSSQQETSSTNDLRTPAKTEPRTPRSSAGETVAMLQPGTPSAQAPLSSPAVRALDAEQIKLLMKQGEQFIAAGDVVTARIAFQRAAEAGDAKAAVALGATYDPTVLAKLGVVGISADVAKARSWYEKAEKLGSPDAKQRLELLVDR
jgi:hypothetical protein